MSSLIDQVLGSLDGNTINQIAAQLGTSPRHAEGAIQAALPLLIGAMGRSAATKPKDRPATSKARED